MPGISGLETKLLICSWAGLVAFGALEGGETEVEAGEVGEVTVWGGVSSTGG